MYNALVAQWTVNAVFSQRCQNAGGTNGGASRESGTINYYRSDKCVPGYLGVFNFCFCRRFNCTAFARQVLHFLGIFLSFSFAFYCSAAPLTCTSVLRLQQRAVHRERLECSTGVRSAPPGLGRELGRLVRRNPQLVGALQPAGLEAPRSPACFSTRSFLRSFALLLLHKPRQQLISLVALVLLYLFMRLQLGMGRVGL